MRKPTEEVPMLTEGYGRIGARREIVGSLADEQHSLARTVVLHLLPGALVTALYLVAAPVVRDFGFPSLMAFFLAASLVIIPYELGYLLYRARKDGTSFGGVVLYREPVPRTQFVALVLGLLAWSGIFFVLVYPPLDAFFIQNVFWWVPDSFFLVEDFARYPTSALVVTWVFGLVVNGVTGPVVEEVYFRGYLLPRISRFGAWAPLINTVFFSIYHFFTPWQNVGRIVGLLPMVYAAWWKRSIYVSMGAHALGNVSAMLLMLPVLFG
jgi:membrane protease YdiL (CAAX protease family)